MGLITFFLLGAFSLFYASRSFDNKPQFINKAVDFIGSHIQMLSIFSIFYGIVAAALVPVLVVGGMEIIVQLVANVLIIILALPYAFGALNEKSTIALQQEMSMVYEKTTRLSVWVGEQQRLLGMVGVVVTLLMFGFVFR